MPRMPKYCASVPSGSIASPMAIAVAKAIGARKLAARPVVAVAGGRAFTFRYAETEELLEAAGCRLVEMVHLPGHRAQPEWQACRRCQRTGHERVRVNPVCTSCGGAGWFRPTQAHAHRNYSTLLICRKGRRRP